jgi:hypothetical protein
MEGLKYPPCSVSGGDPVLTNSQPEDVMKYRCLKLFPLAFALSIVAGCLQKDVTETWYVDRAGTVTWVVQEANVRSDSQSPVDRAREESEYWLAVQQERHPIRDGLRELGGVNLRTRVLRSEVPYTVQTDAKFTGLDVIGQRLIAAIGATGTSIVERTGDGAFEWTLVVRDPSAFSASVEPSDGVSDLLNSLDVLKVVLAVGRFEGAEGFTMSSDRRVAVFSYDVSESKTEQPAITLKLTWRIGER